MRRLADRGTAGRKDGRAVKYQPPVNCGVSHAALPRMPSGKSDVGRGD